VFQHDGQHFHPRRWTAARPKSTEIHFLPPRLGVRKVLSVSANKVLGAIIGGFPAYSDVSGIVLSVSVEFGLAAS